MARPRRNAEGKTAQGRLEEAFWDLLAEASYDEITIMGLSKRANVNHNTFYRYYDNLDDMAKKLFDGVIAGGLPAVLLSNRLLDEAEQKAIHFDFEPENVRKAFLFARSGSSYLTGILHETVVGLWLDEVGVDKECLTVEQRMDIDVIFGGLMTAFGDPELPPDPSILGKIANRPLGKGMLATLAALAKQA